MRAASAPSSLLVLERLSAVINFLGFLDLFHDLGSGLLRDVVVAGLLARDLCHFSPLPEGLDCPSVWTNSSTLHANVKRSRQE